MQANIAAQSLSTQDSNALALLLESFARQQRYIPECAQPLREDDDLPEGLRRLACTVQPPAVWRAWREDARLWFIVGQTSECLAELPSPTVLELLFVSQDAEAVAAGAWCLTRQGIWVFSHLLEPNIELWGRNIWSPSTPRDCAAVS